MDQAEWYVTQSATGGQLGPLAAADFRDAPIRGEVQPDDLVWRDGMTGWEAAAPFLWFAAQRPAPDAEPEPGP